jgi:hypothetical protein
VPIAQRDQRSNVLKAGSKGGWTHDQGLFDGNDLIRDLFESERGQVRAIWVRTPWSDSGRYAGAIFYDAQAGKERNLWKVTGAGGLLDLLAGS